MSYALQAAILIQLDANVAVETLAQRLAIDPCLVRDALETRAFGQVKTEPDTEAACA
jgi:hypothetical protein